jgi:hypothetical protein
MLFIRIWYSMTDRQHEEVRAYVKELKLLYKEVFVSCCVFAFCLFAWLATGGGFWPLWVLLAFVVKIMIRAVSMGLVNVNGIGYVSRWTSFLSPEWEEKQIAKYSAIFEKRQECDNECDFCSDFNVKRESGDDKPQRDSVRKKNASDARKKPKSVT